MRYTIASGICNELRYNGSNQQMPPKTQKLIDELREYCDEERGRRAEIAKLIGIKRQSITDWFSGRQQPTAEQILEVQEFLDKQRRRR
jgi:transcriptional regulator with XRE-family HTH domain